MTPAPRWRCTAATVIGRPGWLNRLSSTTQTPKATDFTNSGLIRQEAGEVLHCDQRLLAFVSPDQVN